MTCHANTTGYLVDICRVGQNGDDGYDLDNLHGETGLQGDVYRNRGKTMKPAWERK